MAKIKTAWICPCALRPRKYGAIWFPTYKGALRNCAAGRREDATGRCSRCIEEPVPFDRRKKVKR